MVIKASNNAGAEMNCEEQLNLLKLKLTVYWILKPNFHLVNKNVKRLNLLQALNTILNKILWSCYQKQGGQYQYF